MSVASPELSVVVLCYRAESETAAVVLPLHALLEERGVDFELILVANTWPFDDDSTPGAAADLARRLPRVSVVARDKEGGMGWDLQSGFRAARGAYLVFVDGDGQVPVGYVLEVYHRLRAGTAELVKGRRQGRQDGLVRVVSSFAYNLLFRALFHTNGVWDINGRPKGLTRSALERLDLRADDWWIDAEIVLKSIALGLRISEIPVRFLCLESRPSFVGPGTVWEFLVNMARWRLGRHPVQVGGSISPAGRAPRSAPRVRRARSRRRRARGTWAD